MSGRVGGWEGGRVGVWGEWEDGRVGEWETSVYKVYNSRFDMLRPRPCARMGGVLGGEGGGGGAPPPLSSDAKNFKRIQL